MKIFLHRNGHNFGPYSEKALADFVKSGLIEERINAWRKDLPSWVPLTEILQSSEQSSSKFETSQPTEEESKIQIVCSDELEWEINQGSEISFLMVHFLQEYRKTFLKVDKKNPPKLF